MKVAHVQFTRFVWAPGPPGPGASVVTLWGEVEKASKNAERYRMELGSDGWLRAWTADGESAMYPPSVLARVVPQE